MWRPRIRVDVSFLARSTTNFPILVRSAASIAKRSHQLRLVTADHPQHGQNTDRNMSNDYVKTSRTPAYCAEFGRRRPPSGRSWALGTAGR